MNTAPELRFGPSRGKAIFLIGMGVFFGVGGCFLVREKPPQGALMLAFAVAMLGTGIALMMPSLTYLKLDAEGIVVGRMGRKDRTRWIDVRGLSLVEVKANRMIAFQYTEAYGRNKALCAVSSTLSGFEGAIPCHFDLEDEELLRPLVEWHSRYAPHEALRPPSAA